MNFRSVAAKRTTNETVCLLYYFNFERNYDVLKSKSLCILLNKNIDFNKNETESKMENSTYSKIPPCASAHIRVVN